MSTAAEARPASARPGRLAREMRPRATQAANLLRALANEQRLMILCHLIDQPLAVGELNQRVSLSQSALSQHLSVLRGAGLVRTEREAQSIRYSLPPGVVTRLLDVLHAEFCPR